MKTRNGFVSNSSSSSFVIVASVEAHKKIIAELHPFFKACIESLEIKEQKIFGKDVVTFGHMEDAGGCGWDYFEYEGERPLNKWKEPAHPSDAMPDYVSKAKEIAPEEVLEFHQYDG